MNKIHHHPNSPGKKIPISGPVKQINDSSTKSHTPKLDSTEKYSPQF